MPGKDPIRSLVVSFVVLSLISFMIIGVVVYVNGLLDPDNDGIPTWRDPQPYVHDGTIDGDGDGWINDYERLIGTNPQDPDQDKDGLPDGGDSDSDRMSNWFERNVADLDPLTYNGRYYIQLMSIPFSTVNETANREFWVEKEQIEPEHYIVQYSVTLTTFKTILTSLAQEVTENDLVFLYLKTHGNEAVDSGGEPILCFADEESPYEADRCGEVITYRQLSEYLGMLHPRQLAIVYSSCAGTDAVQVLSKGVANRTVIGVMGLTVGVPSVDLPILARGTTDSYFSLNNLIFAVKESDPNMTSQRIADPGGLAELFYFGEYSIMEYRQSMREIHIMD